MGWSSLVDPALIAKLNEAKAQKSPAAQQAIIESQIPDDSGLPPATQTPTSNEAMDLIKNKTGKAASTVKDKTPMDKDTKNVLIQSGISAGAGLLEGLAKALMYEDPNARQAGHAAIPGGSVSSVQGGRQMPIQYGKQDLPMNRSDLALALLGKG